ncbi:LOW QUALITY PROTEIN: WD repeat-containing protein 93 [Podargus strigoides]
MAAYIQKHPLEIPPPSEKDWLKDDEEDFFLQDPDQERDALPQPFRMINKLVMLVFENAMEITERREMLQEAQKLKVQPTKCLPTAEFQVTGRANCLTASGKYIFVGLSVGLAAFEASDCKEVCAWDVVKAEVCAIHASDLGNEHHVLLAVDEMGLVWLFCFYKESFLLTKILNEVEDISKRSTCVEVVLSSGGDYTGVLLQGNTKAWLEIYRLPKDSWLKEMEKSPGTAAGVACREKRSSWTSVVFPQALLLQTVTARYRLNKSVDPGEFPVSANKADAKLSLPVLLLKVKPPKPITGQDFKSPLDALKKVDDGSMLGLGYNHLIKDSQWEQQEAIFRSTYWEYLEAEGERESKEETPRPKAIIRCMGDAEVWITVNMTAMVKSVGRHFGPDIDIGSQKLISLFCQMNGIIHQGFNLFFKTAHLPAVKGGTYIPNSSHPHRNVPKGTKRWASEGGRGTSPLWFFHFGHIVIHPPSSGSRRHRSRRRSRYSPDGPRAGHRRCRKRRYRCRCGHHGHCGGPRDRRCSLLLSFVIPFSVLDIPVGISVHWDGSHSLCFYFLNCPLKEKVDSDPKPDVLWPCAAPIACSAVSSCSRYLALACEDATITVWDKHLAMQGCKLLQQGLTIILPQGCETVTVTAVSLHPQVIFAAVVAPQCPLSVTAFLEERFICSTHFLRSSAAASDETPCRGTDPACPIVQLLVLCTDSSFYLMKAPRAGKSSITVLADRPEDPDLAVSAVVPVLAFPSATLIFSWDGVSLYQAVSLMNTATSQIVYCFSTPPSHAVGSPWQPVFTVDSVNWCLLLRGDKQQQADALAQSRDSHSTIFIFDFTSYPLKEAFPKELDLPLKSLQNLPWLERCNIFLRDIRQQSLMGLQDQLPEYWNQLQAQAAAMDKERQKVKEQKKLAKGLESEKLNRAEFVDTSAIVVPAAVPAKALCR